MLVLEIAGGIILALVLLSRAREILAFALAGVAAVLAVVVAVYTLDTLVPLKIVLPWLVFLVVLLTAGVGVYSWVTGKTNMSEEEAQEWTRKSPVERCVHRVAMSSLALILGGGALASALSAVGLLK